MTVKTEFRIIGKSGKTADGRTISPKDIDDMAESYDPKEFTARLWPEHERWQPMGKVIALKAETDNKGRRVLLAQLEPSARLISAYRAGYYQYASMEMSKSKNFAGTGMRYLVGLGVTDSPASMGVEDLNFSQNDEHKIEFFADGVDSYLTNNDEAPNWFNNFLEKISFNQQKDDEVDEKQLTEFADKLAAKFAEKNTEQLKDALTEVFNKQGEENNQKEDPPSKDDTSEDDDKFKALAKENEDLKTKFSELENKLDTLQKQAKPKTPTPEDGGMDKKEGWS